MPEINTKPTTNKDRLKEITDSIETGIQDLFQSDKYANYLRTMSRFHKYSVNNTMLIYLQRPDATLVAGFNKWHDQFSRNVMKGEKGIKIIAPTPFKKEVEEAKLDPDTKAPLLDADGKIIMEEKEVKVPMYKVVSVFDVSQTDGKPLPELAADLSGNVQNYDVFMAALIRSSPVPLAFEKMTADMDGYFSVGDQRIAIREGMSEVQTVSAAVHEIAHSKLHNRELADEKEQWKLVMISDGGTRKDFSVGFGTQKEVEAAGDSRGWKFVDENGFEWHLETQKDAFTSEFLKKNRNTEEVEAESVSFTVCAYYGIATSENSFGYIATWSKDKELPELRTSLEAINKTASGLITDIDRNYAAIMKERGLDKTEPYVVNAEQPSLGGGEITGMAGETFGTSAPLPPYPSDYPMPDPTMTVADRNAYGYTENDMLPLSYEKAAELMEKDETIYMLKPGNTAIMAFDMDDINQHKGLFGIRREDWDSDREYLELAEKHKLTDQELEYSFLNNHADAFAMYQLKHTEDTRDLRFEPLEHVTTIGLTVDRGNYDLVYTAPLTPGVEQEAALNKLYEQFNLNHPADFTGHSLSVSDIVALKQNGAVSCHYVDSVGFVELPAFLNLESYLKPAGMAMEDDYGMIDGIINDGSKQPTVAELEQQAKSGQPISLLELAEASRREQDEKIESVMERLRNQPVSREHEKRAPNRGAEIER